MYHTGLYLLGLLPFGQHVVSDISLTFTHTRLSGVLSPFMAFVPAGRAVGRSIDCGSDRALMYGSLNVPAELSTLLTCVSVCAQFDGEGAAPEERLQEEHSQFVPI